MLMLATGTVRGARGLLAVASLVAAVACGEIESGPTAASALPDRSAAVPSGSGRGAGPAPSPTPTPAPAPAPTGTPTQPTTSTTGRVEVTIHPSPVPFSGQPISDIASCQNRPNTWFYDQVVRETGGVAVTVTERVDSFDGAVTSRTNPGLRIPANGSTTIRTRWCSSSSSAHTAQTSFTGTDANGRPWSVTGATVRLLTR
jgi:hypothetical protein